MGLSMGFEFIFAGATLLALPSGALFWPERGLLIVSDLHFGKSARLARRGGALIPPYEDRATLDRLERAIATTDARAVLALGDSFDDVEAAEQMDAGDRSRLQCLMAGRDWFWVEGNHDAGPAGPFGAQWPELTLGGIHFRHIGGGIGPEVSGHLHPKARLAGRSHPCFVTDGLRLILPSFGCYTGGIWVNDPVITRLLTRPARAILTGAKCRIIPLPATPSC